MRSIRAVVIFAAGFVVSLFGLLLVLVFGLVVHEYIVFPLALEVSGILATLACGWVANWLVGDGTRTRLLASAIAVEVGAAVVWVIYFLIARLQQSILGPIIYPALVGALVLGLIATLCAHYLREPEQLNARSARETQLLLALIVASVGMAVLLAWAIGATGA